MQQHNHDRLIAEVRQIAAYAEKCALYGPSDALRDHIAKALRCADDLEQENPLTRIEPFTPLDAGDPAASRKGNP